jgi:hypothetical protein
MRGVIHFQLSKWVNTSALISMTRNWSSGCIAGSATELSNSVGKDMKVEDALEAIEKALAALRPAAEKAAQDAAKATEEANEGAKLQAAKHGLVREIAAKHGTAAGILAARQILGHRPVDTAKNSTCAPQR